MSLYALASRGLRAITLALPTTTARAGTQGPRLLAHHRSITSSIVVSSSYSSSSSSSAAAAWCRSLAARITARRGILESGLAARGVDAMALGPAQGFHTTTELHVYKAIWKKNKTYTIRPIGRKKTGGRDHTGRIRTHGIGGGHRQCYRMIDFKRLPVGLLAGRLDENKTVMEEKVMEVRYDPLRSADIALVAGGTHKRWIIATQSMQPGDVIKTSGFIGRMAVLAHEGDAYPVGALPVGTLINNLEVKPGAGAQLIRAAGTCGLLIRKVEGTAIIQLPSKHQIQVAETCMATVGRVSRVDHNKEPIGKAGRNRRFGRRPQSGLWQRKGGWAGRKIRPLPPIKNYAAKGSLIKPATPV
ncbi:large ribosomal subunit protein uL2m [Lampetra planeri]